MLWPSRPPGVVPSSNINDAVFICNARRGRVRSCRRALDCRPERRGRPVNADGEETRERLLDAAATTCAEAGFDGATMSQIARRAGVTPAAIYNYYGSREELLYAAGRRGLERVTEVVPEGAGTNAAQLIATAYLQPEFAQTRRLLAELHLASNRDPKLAALLGSWHESWAEAMRERAAGRRS